MLINRRVLVFSAFGIFGVALVSCGNPLGSSTSVVPNARPSRPNPQSAPVLIMSQQSFVKGAPIAAESGPASAPKMLVTSGSPLDFNRRGDGHSPAGVTPAHDGSLAIQPDSNSECGIACTVNNLYLSVASFFAGEVRGVVHE